MKSSQFLKLLNKYPVFDTKMINDILPGSPSYNKVYVHRLKKAGELHEIERGKYTVYEDPFLIASRIVWPSYITAWSSLRYHNLTEQIPHAVWVLTTRSRRKKTLEFMGTRIYFVVTSPKNLFGYLKYTYQGHEIFVADPEKSIIDGLLFKKVPITELADVLSNNIKRIDTPRLIRYAKRTGNIALIKRLGYLLEREGIDFHARLNRWTYEPMVRLEPRMPSKGEVDRKWKIFVNVRL